LVTFGSLPTTIADVELFDWPGDFLTKKRWLGCPQCLAARSVRRRRRAEHIERRDSIRRCGEVTTLDPPVVSLEGVAGTGEEVHTERGTP
jgi:hypothetical protein